MVTYANITMMTDPMPDLFSVTLQNILWLRAWTTSLLDGKDREGVPNGGDRTSTGFNWWPTSGSGSHFEISPYRAASFGYSDSLFLKGLMVE